MGYKAQRFGIRIGRGWAVLLLLGGALLLAAYWIGPLRPLPARIELLAIEGDVAVTEVEATTRRTADGSVVFAVPLAVRNSGAQTAHPRRVMLSVPAPFRLATTRGRLQGAVTPGVPLRSYAIDLPARPLEPAEATQVLPGLDTIYIEPELPRYYCSTQGLGIPEFSPAPSYDPETLSNVRIFYSFRGAAGGAPQTGVLAVKLDPALLGATPAAAPPVFRTFFEEPEATAPIVGPLSFAGARTVHCGDPEQPVELYTVLWETRAGGRVFVLYVDNAGRKRLYDLNRDGIIELETWDADGDGRFEARREARFAAPAFLMPLPPRDTAMTAPDPLRPDSAWLALFRSPQQGVRRFARSPLTAHPQVAVVDSVAADTAAARPAVPGTPAAGTAPARAAAARIAAELGPVPPVTPQFLALFADTTAGPFRFAQRPRPVAMPATAGTPQPRAPAAPPVAADTAVADPVAAEPEPEPEPEPQRPRRRQPLGTPIVPPR